MRRIVHILTAGVLSVSMLMATPLPALATTTESTRRDDNRRDNNRRGNGNYRDPQGSHAGSRPGNNTKPADRPGNNKPGNDRPGNDRPGNNRPGNDRPGNNKPGNNRPGNNRPGQGFAPGHNGNGPGHPGNVPDGRPDLRPGRPGFHPGPNHPATMPPQRPGRPAGIHYGRPTPPPAGWRPTPGRPWFSTILGLAPGLTISLSLNHLYNAGMTVDGYSGNAIYLRNISQLGMNWPEATLIYDNAGRLTGVQLYYSSSSRNLSRYYQAYNTLCASYGAPVSVSDYNNELGASWWGPDGRFISLECAMLPGSDGRPRWFTTLSFGN